MGGTSEVVDVKAEAPQLQIARGERSATVTSSQIDNLPIASRTYQAFAALAPGTDGVNRLGGGGGNNYMMDGVVVMDPGNGGPAMRDLRTHAEVKVLTSVIRPSTPASGLQIPP